MIEELWMYTNTIETRLGYKNIGLVGNKYTNPFVTTELSSDATNGSDEMWQISDHKCHTCTLLHMLPMMSLIDRM